MNKILLYWKGREGLTLKECVCNTVNFITNISKFIELDIFYHNSKSYNINNSKLFEADLYKYLKKEINAYRLDKIKNIDENYINDLPNRFIILSKGKWEFSRPECIVFDLAIGGSDKGYNNSIFITGEKAQPILSLLFRKTIEFYCPDWGVISDIRTYGNQKLVDYYIGWQTFFSDNIEVDLDFNKNDFADVELIPNKGVIYWTDMIEYNSTNPNQYEKIDKLYTKYFKDKALNSSA